MMSWMQWKPSLAAAQVIPPSCPAHIKMTIKFTPPLGTDVLTHCTYHCSGTGIEY